MKNPFVLLMAVLLIMVISVLKYSAYIGKEKTIVNAKQNAEFYVLNKNYDIKRISCTSHTRNKATCVLVSDIDTIYFVECPKVKPEPFKSSCRPIPSF